ncbi:MAG: autotransporter outer membrane beta-barrel domain-containing protein, partial [Pseudomonadota bacterium]
ASLDYTKVKFDDYREKGGYMALNVEHDDYDMANLGLGVQLLKSFTMNCVMLTPDASAMVYYDLIGDDIETTSTFVGGTHAFTTTGADADRTTFDLGLGLTIGGVECPASFRVGYEYIDRGDFESHNFTGKLRYEF